MVSGNSVIDIEDVKIDRTRVCRRIGYSPGHELPARVTSLMDDYIENVNSLIDPQYSYAIREVEWVQDNRVFIEGSVVLESGVIARLLENCQKVAMFVMTIGKHLEETVNRLTKDGLMVQSAMLDAIGSNAAEKTAASVQDEVKAVSAKYGYVISPRFSPGYCDWDIRQQQMVFRAVDGDSLGVQLTENNLMIPRKSISGVIGIGTPESGIEKYNPCKKCRNSDCTSRRSNLTV